MKSLRAFKRIKNMYKYFVKKSRDLEPKLMICEKEDFNLVEKELKALKIIKGFNAYSIEQIQGQWYLFMGEANVRNTNRKPIDEETAMLLREVLL